MNRGQVDSGVLFLSRTPGAIFYLLEDGALMALDRGAANGSDSGGRRRWRGIRMRLAGAEPASRIHGESPVSGMTNYIGGRGRKELKNVPSFALVRYSGVYAGVDMIYRDGGDGFEFDFLLSAGVRPDVIALEFEGIENALIDEERGVLLSLGEGNVRIAPPRFFQGTKARRRELRGGYVVRELMPARVKNGFRVESVDVQC